jgi:hypothetical protein
MASIDKLELRDATGKLSPKSAILDNRIAIGRRREE